MDQPPNLPVEQNKLRLAALFDSASKHAAAANQRAAQVSVDIGKERVQYFEKIALASGGTIGSLSVARGRAAHGTGSGRRSRKPTFHIGAA